MSLKVVEIESFIAVVEAGSISRAAANLDVPKSKISRHLKQLEEELNTRLLDRTTRSVSLTEAGELFYAGAQRILLELDHLRGELHPDDEHLTGRLSIFAPGEFTSQIISPRIELFARDYPGIELEFLSGAGQVDMLHDRLDLIIHPDAPQDSSYVATKLCNAHTDFYASPAYLARHGQPQHPSELYHHSCIAELSQNRQVRSWVYREGKNAKEVRINSSYRSDSLATLRTMAERGLGIAMLPVFYCAPLVGSGQLIQLFDGQYMVNHDIYGIYSSRRLKPRKLEVFLDFLNKNIPDII